MRNSGGIWRTVLVIGVAVLFSGSVFAATDAGAEGNVNWSAPAFRTTQSGKIIKGVYKPIPVKDITKEWKLCVLFPHLKDPYWLATNYGTLIEAKRDKADYQLFAAAGYNDLPTQINQMENCVTQHYDAIILGAISAKGNCPQIAKALAAKIPVVDFINGVDCPNLEGNPLFSHARVSFYSLAETTAKYIIKHPKADSVKVGFFPGPEGASWSDAAVKGFNDGIKGSKVSIAVMRRGDTGQAVQLKLIENSLRTYPDINTIVGVDIAAEAGVVAVRNAGKKGKVDVYAFDMLPSVYEDAIHGDAVGGPTDYTTIQGRMAVDQAIRMLEGQKLEYPMSGPIPEMVTADNAKQIPYDSMFAPKRFRATYKWLPKG